MDLFSADVEDGGEELSLVPQLESPGSGLPLHALSLNPGLRERLRYDHDFSDEVRRIICGLAFAFGWASVLGSVVMFG